MIQTLLFSHIKSDPYQVESTPHTGKKKIIIALCSYDQVWRWAHIHISGIHLQGAGPINSPSPEICSHKHHQVHYKSLPKWIIARSLAMISLSLIQEPFRTFPSWVGRRRVARLLLHRSTLRLPREKRYTQSFSLIQASDSAAEKEKIRWREHPDQSSGITLIRICA